MRVEEKSAEELGIGRGDTVILTKESGIGDPGVYNVVEFRANQPGLKGKITLQSLDGTKAIYTSPEEKIFSVRHNGPKSQKITP